MDEQALQQEYAADEDIPADTDGKVGGDEKESIIAELKDDITALVSELKRARAIANNGISAYLDSIGHEWANEVTKEYYARKFERELSHANENTHFRDILDALIKDENGNVKDGLFRQSKRPYIVDLAAVSEADEKNISRGDFMKMGYKERARLRSEQPEMYDALCD